MSNKEKKLVPARNLRRQKTRCCGTCAYGFLWNGVGFQCRREGGHSSDVGDLEYFFWLCEGYKPGGYGPDIINDELAK